MKPQGLYTQKLLLLLLLVVLLNGCAGLPANTQPVRVNLVSMNVVDMQLFEQRYALTIRIKNPNPQPLKVAGLDFSLQINGEDFADGVSNRAVEIPAYGEATTEVQVSSSLFKLFEQFRALEERGGDRLNYRIKGSVGLDESWTRLPFEREGRISMDTDRKSQGI